jgi:hypothetical protein
MIMSNVWIVRRPRRVPTLLNEVVLELQASVFRFFQGEPTEVYRSEAEALKVAVDRSHRERESAMRILGRISAPHVTANGESMVLSAEAAARHTKNALRRLEIAERVLALSLLAAES